MRYARFTRGRLRIDAHIATGNFVHSPTSHAQATAADAKNGWAVQNVKRQELLAPTN
ncbi:MAG: hypothetical protein ACREBG_04175 [Pyrinomonadaceae bacterium]